MVGGNVRKAGHASEDSKDSAVDQVDILDLTHPSNDRHGSRLDIMISPAGRTAADIERFPSVPAETVKRHLFFNHPVFFPPIGSKTGRAAAWGYFFLVEYVQKDCELAGHWITQVVLLLYR